MIVWPRLKVEQVGELARMIGCLRVDVLCVAGEWRDEGKEKGERKGLWGMVR